MALLGGGLVALIVAALWVRWLDHHLAVLPGWRPGVRRLAGVLVGGLPVLFVLTYVWSRVLDPAPLRPVAWVTFTWAAVAFYLTLGVLVLAVITAPLLVLRDRGRAVRRRVHRVLVPIVVLAALAVTAFGLVEASRPRVVEVAVTSAELPAAWDGARIALVTDLHVGPVRGAAYTRRVVDLVNAERPDLVVLGGDLIDGRERWVGPDLDPLADLVAPLGVLAVTGNHEYLSGNADAYVARWRTLGITPLLNQSTALERGGESVTVAGLTDRQADSDQSPDPDAALAGVAPDDFTILLAHEPGQVIAGRGVDLQLSGHTHGGQLWPFGYAVELDQPTLAGVDDVDGVTVVTSRGVGTWGPPVRVGAPPDVVVVTVRRGPS